MFRIILLFCTLDGAECKPLYLKNPEYQFTTLFDCEAGMVDFLNNGGADEKAIELGLLDVSATCMSDQEIEAAGLELEGKTRNLL